VPLKDNLLHTAWRVRLDR